MKKTVLVVLCLALAASGVFAGPGQGQQGGGAIYIPLISKGFQHQFWQAVKSGADQAAKELNVVITFEGPESETMVDKQMDMLQTAMAKSPRALGIAALDSKAAIPILQQAQRNKIPVIAFDSGVDSDIPLTTVSTDNKAAAALAADKMAEAIGGSGKVAVVVHDQVSRTGMDRRDGFLERMKAQYPNIQVVSVQYGDGDHRKSADIAKAVITANPDLKGYYGANEGSAIGVVLGVGELKQANPRLDIKIIGFDSGKQQLDAIRSGLMYGAVQQNPVKMGYETVRAAVDALNGKSLPKITDSGFVWADRSNLDSPEVKAVIYE
ncbi:MAG: ABC transporter substrate-binding protein [Treponema sp.]|jgi:ribose transport system substrate-binding protein|nr:ABC transporter substrate-binding protein [Treponema sp.]